MNLLEIDRSGEATRLSLEAQGALSVGDTPRAQSLFEQAGKELEQSAGMLRKRGEKGAALFLAATQYYKGGHYQKAQQICRKIQARLLPDQMKDMFVSFRKDVEERAAPDYPERIRGLLKESLKNKAYEKILDVLREHPFVLSPAGMAYLRAVCCEHLCDYRTAALFFADAVKFRPENASVIFETAAAHPLKLIDEHNFGEAEEYLTYQLELLPHPFTYVNASLLRFHQAAAAAPERAKELLEELLKSHESAWNSYLHLPPSQQAYPDLPASMVLSFEAAALALRRLGRSEEAVQMCNRAAAFAPTSPAPLTVRALLTYPDPQAIRDCLKAIKLGDKVYLPYYFLAHAALKRGDYARADSFSSQALHGSPGQEVKAQLVEWQAIARSHLGRDFAEVRRLFGQAMQLDPTNQRIRDNFKNFETWAQQASPALPSFDWQQDPLQGVEKQHLIQQVRQFADRSRQTGGAAKQLAMAHPKP